MSDLTMITDLERRIEELEKIILGARGLQNQVLTLRKKVGEPLRRKAAAKAAHPANKDTWTEYCKAFHRRYMSRPLENARNRSLIKQLVNRVGHENAVRLVVFYLRQEDMKYTKAYHGLNMLIMDCEGLLVRMETGKNMTHQEAQKNEQSAGNVSVQSEFLRRKHGNK